MTDTGKPCPECEGDGYINDPETDWDFKCETCGGSGWVLMDESENIIPPSPDATWDEGNFWAYGYIDED